MGDLGQVQGASRTKMSRDGDRSPAALILTRAPSRRTSRLGHLRPAHGEKTLLSGSCFVQYLRALRAMVYAERLHWLRGTKTS